MPIALGAIFLLLYMTFGSLRQAALVFCNVPFATIGGVIALWASGEFLSVPASVGFIALMGIAVLNGVVLISYINEVCARGTLPFREAVMEGARRRLRPVTLTASIAALGLVPFLFADGPGAEIQRPLAIVVIGGLITATALTLLLVPILYDRLGSAAGGAPAAGRTGTMTTDDRRKPSDCSPVGLPPIVTQARRRARQAALGRIGSAIQDGQRASVDQVWRHAEAAMASIVAAR